MPFTFLPHIPLIEAAAYAATFGYRIKVINWQYMLEVPPTAMEIF